MAEPDSSPGTLTTETDELQGTVLNTEGMSLSYEELSDGKIVDDRLCYLPEKAEDDCETSGYKDKSVEKVDVTSDNNATEIQTSSGTNNDDCVTSNYEERNVEPDVSGENSTPEIQNLSDCNDSTSISREHTESLEPVDVAGHAEKIEDFEEDANGESKHESNHEHQEVEQMDEPNQQGIAADRSFPERAFTDSAHVSESELQVEETAENGFVEGYQRESFQLPSELESALGGTEGLEDEMASSGGTSVYEENGVRALNATEQRGARQDAGLLTTYNLIPGKQHQNEDDSSTSWRKHKKHFFILSHAGKPIYSRYGDEHKLAGFSATLQAIISFVENSGDCIRYIQAGDHQVVFLVKGPIYLVSISATDEPLEALRGQLELLHGQLLLILTKALEKCFVKNANFDLRPLLGGTEMVFSSLIHSFSWNPASFLHSYTCLPLSHTGRQAAGAALQDVADSDLLFALLLSDSKVISLVGAQKASLHPDDILLLSNFVSSSESFRTTESFSPVCLPNYNAMAFLYAYVRYLDTDTCLILITKNPDGFFHLKECRARVESFLMETHVLRDIANSVARGGLRVEDLPGDVMYGALTRSSGMGNNTDNRTSEPTTSGIRQRAGVGGAAGLWHFMYRSVYLDQYVSSEFSPPLHTHQSQKRLFRAYQRLYTSMHGALAGSHQMQYRRDENHVLLAWSTADFEFFAAFDPLAEKSSAITVCNRVCQWIRDVENDFFYVGASPFNW